MTFLSSFWHSTHKQLNTDKSKNERNVDYYAIKNLLLYHYQIFLTSSKLLLLFIHPFNLVDKRMNWIYDLRDFHYRQDLYKDKWIFRIVNRCTMIGYIYRQAFIIPSRRKIGNICFVSNLSVNLESFSLSDRLFSGSPLISRCIEVQWSWSDKKQIKEGP